MEPAAVPTTPNSGPAVVYLRDGQPAELVARMRDWPVFAQACERLLAPASESNADIGGNA